MKKVCFFLAGMMLWAFPVRAENQDEGFYTRFDAGSVYATDGALKKSMGLQTGFGQKWSDFLRGELTVEYTEIAMKKPQNVWSRSHLSSWAAMGALYVDLFQNEAFSPYVGAGAGMARNDAPDAVVNGWPVFGRPCYRFAWKAAGGVGIRLPANLVLDVGYAYADLGRFSMPTEKQEVKLRKINVGLRYDF